MEYWRQLVKKVNYFCAVTRQLLAGEEVFKRAGLKKFNTEFIKVCKFCCYVA